MSIATLPAPIALPRIMPSPIPAAPVKPPAPKWTPSSELLPYIELLTQGNLAVVADRTFGLRTLIRFTQRDQGLPEDQVRSCTSIKRLPFLRISKTIRTNPINAPFVDAGRAFNRELVQAKINAGRRLAQIVQDDTVPPWVQRLASGVIARVSTLMKVELGELNDAEVPPHLLPPKPNDEPEWLSEPLEPEAPAAAAAEAPAESPEPATPSLAATPATPTTPPLRRGKPFSNPNAKPSHFKKRRK